MVSRSSRNAQLLGAWSGLVAMAVWLVLLWPLTHFIPPPAPSLPTSEVAALYTQNSIGIRLAAILMLLAISLTTVFYGALSAHMRKMEEIPIWSNAQMLNGLLSLVGIVSMAVLWSAAAFRPERSPEIVQAMHDQSWLLYAMVAPPAFMQCVAIGMAILGDINARPIFPRWVAFLSIWTGVLFLPGSLACLFQTGPFAWNGLFSFWLPLSAFGFWTGVLCWAMIRAANQEPRPASNRP